MKIVSLKAENFMKLVAVHIKPDGNTVLLTGKNGAGKSSVLDAIMAALCGKKYTPKKPIREGQEKAEVVVETENFIIKRTFTPKGGTLTITNSDGFKASSPQTLLDKIVGEVAFDPMKFITEYDDRKQRKVLMELVGLNFDDIDEKIREVKEQRSKAKSLKESYEHDLTQVLFTEGLPEEEVREREVVEKLQKEMDHNAAQEKIRRSIGELDFEGDRYEKAIEQEGKAVSRLEREVAAAMVALHTTEHLRAANAKDRAEANGALQDDIDLEPTKKELTEVEQKNALIRANAEHREFAKRIKGQRDIYSVHGKQMKALEEDKAKKLSEVKMPIDGLSVDEKGVVYGGIPLSQVNDAKKLEIGVAISMALNPKLKVIRMKGNDLDSDSLKVVSKMVKAKDYQAWIEKVDETGDLGIVIEDGSVKKVIASSS